MLIDHESLRRVTRAILEAGGSAAAEAELVCDHLVEAHLKGHPSHGVGMIRATTRRCTATSFDRTWKFPSSPTAARC